MMTPIFVAAAVMVIVGELAASRSDSSGWSAFASPKSSTFTVPSSFTLTLAGFRSRWMMPCSWAASRASAICRAMGFVERYRAFGDAVLKRRAFDQFQHERPHITALFQPVDLRDVGVVQGGKDFGFPLKASQAFFIFGERIGEDLQGHVPIERRIGRPIDDAHPAFTQTARDLEDAEATANL